MGFLFEDTTGKDPNSGQYKVSTVGIKGTHIGFVINDGNIGRVIKPGSNQYEAKAFVERRKLQGSDYTFGSLAAPSPDEVRDKLEALQIMEEDIADAVTWARDSLR